MEAPALQILFLTVSFMAFACSKSELNLQGKEIREIAQMIHDEVGTAAADSADRCDIIPIGLKPTGGPWAYLVFSAEISDREKLEELVGKYNQLDAERNEQNGGYSTADMATKPPVTLKNGVCNGEGIYAWNPGDILDFNGIQRD